MTWYTLVLISVAANSIGVICIQRLQKNHQIDVYLFYVWALTTIFLFIFFFPINFKLIQLPILGIIVIAGIGNWSGNYFYNLSIEQQPNLGYVEALASIRIALTYIVSLLFWGSSLSLLKLFSLFGLAIGIYLVTNNPSKVAKSPKSKWWLWSVLAGLMFAILAISTKLMFLRGLDESTTIVSLFGIATMFYFFNAQRKNSLKAAKINIKLILITAIFVAIGNYTLFSSYKLAPNLAYPVAISNSRIVILYISSLAMGVDTLNVKRGIGIFVAFVSAILLS